MAYTFPDQLAETIMESLNYQEKIMESSTKKIKISTLLLLLGLL